MRYTKSLVGTSVRALVQCSTAHSQAILMVMRRMTNRSDAFEVVTTFGWDRVLRISRPAISKRWREVLLQEIQANIGTKSGAENERDIEPVLKYVWSCEQHGTLFHALYSFTDSIRLLQSSLPWERGADSVSRCNRASRPAAFPVCVPNTFCDCTQHIPSSTSSESDIQPCCLLVCAFPRELRELLREKVTVRGKDVSSKQDCQLAGSVLLLPSPGST